MAEKCPKCGAPMEHSRCAYCGYQEEAPASAAAVPPQAAQPASQPQAAQPFPQPLAAQPVSRPQPQAAAGSQTIPASQMSKKSKTAALLLCIFLGYLGVHRFYVGIIGTGVLYLLTGGLVGIGWIVDIITIAAGSFKDQFNLPLQQ